MLVGLRKKPLAQRNSGSNEMTGFIVWSCIVGALLYYKVPDMPLLAAPIMGAMVLGVIIGMRKLLKMDKSE